MRSFQPIAGSTVNIDVSGSSQTVSLVRDNIEQIRIMNDGTATVWVTFGTSAVVASLTTSMPVGPGMAEVVTLPSEPTGAVKYAAAIAAGATGNVYFTLGAGV